MNRQVRVFWAAIAAFCTVFNGIKAQSFISGIINTYTTIRQIDYCSKSLQVNDASGFSPGDKVLVIQLQGADINLSNSSAFGDIVDYHHAGKYEIAEIAAIAGNVITLEYPLVNFYDVTASPQLVSIPSYGKVTVNAQLSCYPWNGDYGGIVALKARHLVLQADVDVSGNGFRGGPDEISGFSCSWFAPQTAYAYNAASQQGRGAWKGEGIAGYVTGYELGRGANANGGGGGNDHNSGGGGGGNFTAGGAGGMRAFESTFECKGDYPGIGGKPLDYNNRLFPGGGGGAGHRNNSFPAPGGNGGGIIIIMADTLTSNGFKIKARGQHADSCYGDGAGGGGAGGSVFLDAGVFMDTLTVDVRGGNGGKVFNPSAYCMGPGGGGSGGVVLFSQPFPPLMVKTLLSGGIAGYTFNNANPSCYGQSNGAANGNDGVVLTGRHLPHFEDDTLTTLRWTGNFSPDWFDPCNWQPYFIPDSTLNVIIPGNTVYNPEITGDTAYCRSLKIRYDQNAKLTIRYNSGGMLKTAD